MGGNTVNWGKSDIATEQDLIRSVSVFTESIFIDLQGSFVYCCVHRFWINVFKSLLCGCWRGEGGGAGL